MTYKLIEEYKKILNGDPLFSVRAPISPLFCVFTWQEKGHPLHTFGINKGRDSYISTNDKEYIAVATDKFRDFFNNKITVEELREEYLTLEKDIFELYQIVSNSDLERLSEEDLIKYFEKLNKLTLRLLCSTTYIENVDYLQILSVTGPTYKEKLDKIWEKATEAAFVSFDGRRLGIILKLIESNSKNIVRLARFIFTDYFWAKSDTEIFAEIEKNKENINEKIIEYRELENSGKDKILKHFEWLSTLDADSRRIAEYLQLVMWMRDVRKDALAQLQAMMIELSEELLKEANMDLALAPNIIMYEYLKGIDYLKSIKKDIESRINGCIYLVYPDSSYKTELCDFDKAVKDYNAFLDSTIKKSENLKGQTACKGKVKGIVRVIFDPSVDQGFKEGDILVTSMTRPEYVPLMKKAGAVVTNEGGITCHAAIVSRELNIPCIIGTKIATQVLKDGDMVEVDAEKGVVKIIK